MTLLEVVVAMCVLSVGALLYSQATLSLQKLRSSCREGVLAADAIQQLLERARSEPFSSVYALYNSNPFDDPAGPGTAPGSRFGVPGLDPAEASPDGLVGQIHLPEIEVAPRTWRMCEEQALTELGLPRDLNGDSMIDDKDHSSDYRCLPVRITVDWSGRYGERHLEMSTLLIEFQR